MSSKELPVINFGSFRKYPTSAQKQEYADDREVCRDCLSGVCCSTEGPIYLASFDIFRLAAFFDMSAAEFMLTFTQDRFDDEDSDEMRRPWIDDPDSSIVTYLRRRDSRSSSACIFLKYIRDTDGAPRQICSVWPGRPLACREFYFDGCKSRVTGELAGLLATGLEKIRDGEITASTTKRHLDSIDASSDKVTVAQSLAHAFWAELNRAANMDAANLEGGASYEMSDYQDSIDEKLNRLLSSKHLRFEEDYGPKPRDEQLHPYTAGRSFAGSPEYDRIMKIVRSRPSNGLFSPASFEYRAGVRTLIKGANHAGAFKTIPNREARAFLDGLPDSPLFPDHPMREVRRVTARDINASVLKGFNHLIRFASRIVTVGEGIEDEPGRYETELLSMMAGLRTSSSSYISNNPYLEPVRSHIAEAVIRNLEARLAEAASFSEFFAEFKLLFRIKPLVPFLSGEVQNRVRRAGRSIAARLRTKERDINLGVDNPIEGRLAQGKRLDSRKAWTDWNQQALNMRYAAQARLEINLPAFYQRSLNTFEKIPFKQTYAASLREIICRLAESMSCFNTLKPGKHAGASRLILNWRRLSERMEDTGCDETDYEVLADIVFAVYRGLGLSYENDPRFGAIVWRLIDSQLPDGSWKTNPLSSDLPDLQAEYLTLMYRPTWKCIDALRS